VYGNRRADDVTGDASYGVINRLREPVVITFKLNRPRLIEPQCVFWNYTARCVILFCSYTTRCFWCVPLGKASGVSFTWQDVLSPFHTPCCGLIYTAVCAAYVTLFARLLSRSFKAFFLFTMGLRLIKCLPLQCAVFYRLLLIAYPNPP